MTQKSRRAALALVLTTNLVLAATAPRAAAQAAGDAPLDGFTAEGSAAQRRLEDRFRASPAPAQAREHLRQLTKDPHVAGTPEDYQTAVYVRDRLRAYGVAAELKEYQVLLPTPRAPTVLELLAPRRERLLLREPVVAEDASSASPKIIPLFNGYSASGDVTAPLVYVNFGLPEDYRALKKLNVEVKGKIAIARYGRSFRGVKAKVAEENGAIGLVIYSDPADDGYAQGDVYPSGPWRPEWSAQRGSVMYIFHYPGDPLTPGTPAVPGTPRLTREQATNLPRIPVQPISYGDARKLLAPLRGPVRPEGFQGGLPFAYHVGGTPDVRVRLKTDMEFKQTTIWNVVGRIDGAQEPDRWIILGNHRDAWTFGAVDPNSGSTAMLEAARAMGELLKTGWRPRRTIIFGSWDAEEQGLIGSTEWAEEFANELREKAVAYVNMDAAVSGANFGASSVPSLWKLVRASARDVRDPKTGKSVYQAWQDRSRTDPELTDASGTDAPIAEARIGALGSGSDYTPFLQHLGVPSIDMGFGGDYGVYHSAYDSFHWMAKFGDPRFEYHTASAQIWGTVALRLAEAPALPFDYADYAEQIRDFVNETQRTARQRRMAESAAAAELRQSVEGLSQEVESFRTRRRAVEESLYQSTHWPGTKEAMSRALSLIGGDLERAERRLAAARALHQREAAGVEFKAMLDAARELGDEAARVNSRRRELLEDVERERPRAVARLRKLNDAVIAAERALTDARGLRGRPWYRHQIYAPGFYTGYAAQPLPDLRQAIDDRNTVNAREAAERIAEAIRRAAQALKAGRDD